MPIRYKKISDRRGEMVAHRRLTNSGMSFVLERRKGTGKTLDAQRKWEMIHKYDVSL
jgi:hypothetical protein